MCTQGTKRACVRGMGGISGRGVSEGEEVREATQLELFFIFNLLRYLSLRIPEHRKNSAPENSPLLTNSKPPATLS